MTTGSKWWDASYNPIGGCSPDSPGCEKCYSATLASTRLAHHPTYAGLTSGGRWTGEVRLNETVLDRGPPKLRGGGILFCCDMADLFHEKVPDIVTARILQQLEETPLNMRPFVLTKREKRMRAAMKRHVKSLSTSTRIRCGVTAEDDEHAKRRIPILFETECFQRFVSFEPLVGPIDPIHVDALDWAIIGGMTGSDPRECHQEWAEDLLYACVEDGIPVWVKQLGGLVIQRKERPCENAGAPDYDWPIGTHFGNPTGRPEVNGRVVLLRDRRGADMQEWPAALRRRERI